MDFLSCWGMTMEPRERLHIAAQLLYLAICGHIVGKTLFPCPLTFKLFGESSHEPAWGLKPAGWGQLGRPLIFPNL